MCTKCAVPHPLTRIGQEIRECYRFEPPKISVEQHIRPTYVCEERHEAPITAPAPPVILPKSMASPSLLAHVTNSKFNLGLPLYRVSQDLKRYRMDLGPGTLGTWMSMVGGEKVVPVINLIRDALFTAPFMHIDETPLQILRSDKAGGSDHYIVVRAGGPPGQRIILYDYLASRTTEGLKQFFMGPDGAYQGKLVSDGLERYDDIAAELKLLHFGCLTHCRTMFFKARKVSHLPSSRTLANAAIEDYIGPVYRIEGQIKALRAEYQQRGEPLPLATVLELRQQKSKPILEKFKAWIDDPARHTAEQRARQGARLRASAMAQVGAAFGSPGNTGRQQLQRAADQTFCDGQKSLALQLRCRQRPGERQPVLAGDDLPRQ